MCDDSRVAETPHDESEEEEQTVVSLLPVQMHALSTAAERGPGALQATIDVYRQKNELAVFDHVHQRDMLSYETKLKDARLRKVVKLRAQLKEQVNQRNDEIRQLEQQRADRESAVAELNVTLSVLQTQHATYSHILKRSKSIGVTLSETFAQSLENLRHAENDLRQLTVARERARHQEFEVSSRRQTLVTQLKNAQAKVKEQLDQQEELEAIIAQTASLARLHETATQRGAGKGEQSSPQELAGDAHIPSADSSFASGFSNAINDSYLDSAPGMQRFLDARSLLSHVQDFKSKQAEAKRGALLGTLESIRKSSDTDELYELAERLPRAPDDVCRTQGRTELLFAKAETLRKEIAELAQGFPYAGNDVVLLSDIEPARESMHSSRDSKFDRDEHIRSSISQLEKRRRANDMLVDDIRQSCTKLLAMIGGQIPREAYPEIPPEVQPDMPDSARESILPIPSICHRNVLPAEKLPEILHDTALLVEQAIQKMIDKYGHHFVQRNTRITNPMQLLGLQDLDFNFANQSAGPTMDDLTDEESLALLSERSQIYNPLSKIQTSMSDKRSNRRDSLTGTSHRNLVPLPQLPALKNPSTNEDRQRKDLEDATDVFQMDRRALKQMSRMIIIRASQKSEARENVND